MSHVSDGALHAYLDGALDEYPSGEAEAIREHLAVCPDCAARVDEERRIRDASTAILVGTTPPIEVPPLEELRARAAALGRAKDPIPVRLYRLGWAASIVLAVGAGWMLRDGQVEPLGFMDPIPIEGLPRLEEAPPVGLRPPPQELTADETAARRELVQAMARRAPPPAEQTSVASEDPTPQATGVAAAARVGPERGSPSLPAAAVVAEALLEAPGADEIEEDVRTDFQLRGILDEDRVAFRDELDAGLTPEAPEAASVVLETTALDLAADERARAALVESVAARPETVAALPETSAARPDSDTTERRERSGSVINSARQVDAGPLLGGARGGGAEIQGADRRGEDDAPGSLVVPGLEVIFIGWLEEGVVLQALQYLEPGDTLELLHLSEGVDPSARPPLEKEGHNEIVVPHDGGWLILRARRSEADLRALLELLVGSG